MGYKFNIFTRKLDRVGVETIGAGSGISIDNTDPSNPVITSNGANITVVTNYSALPTPATASGKFYWVSNSQGTAWLPGSLGGTYYNSGLYYSNGTTWEFLNVPYQATQAAVNTGTVTDQFVTPATLKNSSQWATKQDVFTAQSANMFYAGPTSGSGVPAFRAIVTSDIATAMSTGLAGSATKLATARNINGVSFDGTGDITVLAAPLSTIALGSVIVYNTLNTPTALTSTSGLKVLQNNEGVISWNTVTGTGNSVYSTSPLFTTPQISNAGGTFAYTLVGGAIGASYNLNLPVITANDTFAVLGLAQTFSATQTFTAAATNVTSISLLDTTYKPALSVLSPSNLLLGGSGWTNNIYGDINLRDSAGTYRQLFTAGSNTFTFANGFNNFNVSSYASFTKTITFTAADFNSINVSAAINAAGGAFTASAFRWSSGISLTSGTGTVAGIYLNPTAGGMITGSTLIGVYSNISSAPVVGALGYAQYHAGTGISYLGGNLALFQTPSFGGGVGVVFIGNATTVPTSNPTAGFITWVDPTTGNYMARGKNGTITTLASA